MQKSILTNAIKNNADWCQRIWTSHGLESVARDGLVYCLSDVPDFYPNVVTIEAQPTEHPQIISELRTASALGKFSIKDSFADLKLDAHNFMRLFGAQWLRHSNKAQSVPATNLNWQTVTRETELENWEARWDERAHRATRIFQPSLLADPTIQFWASYSNGEISGGYISNIAEDVVGLSNIFGSYEESIAHARNQFSDVDLVGYEAVDVIPEITKLGSTVIGDLSIWIPS